MISLSLSLSLSLSSLVTKFLVGVMVFLFIPPTTIEEVVLKSPTLLTIDYFHILAFSDTAIN